MNFSVNRVGTNGHPFEGGEKTEIRSLVYQNIWYNKDLNMTSRSVRKTLD